MTCSCGHSFDAAPKDGTYSDVGGHLQLVQAFQALTGDEVEELLAVARQAKSEGPERAEENWEQIKHAQPGVAAALRDLVIPRDPMAFWTMILALAAVVTIWTNWIEADDPVPPEDEVRRGVEDVVENNPTPDPLVPSQQDPPPQDWPE